MADINKCDIEGETRTAYRLKEGAIWEDVKKVYDDTGKYSFGDEFEPVEFPVVELKNQSFEIFEKTVEIHYVENSNKSYKGWNIWVYDDWGKSLEIYVSEIDIIKSIEDFNNRAAMLFGFYLKEPEGGK